MDAFDMGDLLAQHEARGRKYLEFLKVQDLSMGIYRLVAGETDPQQPHDEDEAYYVVSGAATVAVDGEDRSITAGSVVYVAKGVEHRFHTITEDLDLLVFFAPPESK